MKTCNVCKETKPLNLMVKNKGSRGGYRSLCKVCISVQQLDRKRKRKERDAEIARLEAMKPTEPTVAGPRIHVIGKGDYKPEPGYYRNNGNVHIPSRGF